MNTETRHRELVAQKSGGYDLHNQALIYDANDAEGPTVALIYTGLEDAEQIVTRYNAHDQLVEALRACLFYAEMHYRSLPDDGVEQDHMMGGVIEPSRELLKTVGEL